MESTLTTLDVLFLIARLLAVLSGITHFYFFALETLLWQKPLGLKTFRNSPEKARETAILAANQGVYNFALALGLIYAGMKGDLPLLVYTFLFVVIVGVYGAMTFSKRILWLQAFPAMLGLVLLGAYYFG